MTRGTGAPLDVTSRTRNNIFDLLRATPAMLRKLILPSLILGFFASSASADGLRVGRAAVSITPAVGTPMLTPQRPPFEMKYAAEAHDPIQAKAVVIDQGGTRVALIEVDLTNEPLKITQAAKKIIGETTKIDPANVLIATTHTHTAPQLRPKYLGKFDEKSRQLTLDYIAALPGKIAESRQTGRSRFAAGPGLRGDRPRRLGQLQPSLFPA